MEVAEIIEKQIDNRFLKPTWTPELLAALAKAQSEFPELAKNQTAKIETEKGSYEYSYVDLAALFKLTRPVLNKNGLSVSQFVSTEGSGDSLTVHVDTFLFHSSGGYLHEILVLPLVRTGKMNSIQAVGSVITYGRRYSYEAIIGIASQEDTDAQGLNGDGEAQKQRKMTKPATDGDLRKQIEEILTNPAFQADDKLKKEVAGALVSLKNIKEKNSLENFKKLWEKKLAGLPVTPESVAEAVQGEFVEDPGVSEAFDNS